MRNCQPASSCASEPIGSTRSGDALPKLRHRFTQQLEVGRYSIHDGAKVKSYFLAGIVTAYRVVTGQAVYWRDSWGRLQPIPKENAPGVCRELPERYSRVLYGWS